MLCMFAISRCIRRRGRRGRRCRRRLRPRLRPRTIMFVLAQSVWTLEASSIAVLLFVLQQGTVAMIL